jgi:hypothetical protein
MENLSLSMRLIKNYDARPQGHMVPTPGTPKCRKAAGPASQASSVSFLSQLGAYLDNDENSISNWAPFNPSRVMGF